MILNDWFFGIDAGATQTRLYASSQSVETDFELFGGPANVVRQGKKQTGTVLSCLINDALKKIPEKSLCAVHAGVAGASPPRVQEALIHDIRLRVNATHPYQMSISHDGIIALQGAFTGETGLLFIAGTGSGVMARTGISFAETAHVGGWGYLIGDEGSGYSMGRRTLTAVAHALDGGPETILTKLVHSTFGIHDRYSLISTLARDDWEFPRVAPLILNAANQGDAVAISLVQKETELLARQSKWLLAKYPNLTPRYTIIGGLSNNEYYVNTFRRAMKKIWPAGVFALPNATPAEGAVQIAMNQSIDSVAPLSMNL